MATGLRFTMPRTQWFDGSGVPLAGGVLSFFDTGTTTPAEVYADQGLTTPLGTSVDADSSGSWPDIWLAVQSYKVVLATSGGVQIWSADPVVGAAATSTSGTVPVGTIMAWGGPTPNGTYPLPTGWLLCYGQAVSRTTYSALLTAIGTTWGAGDGSTTFNVPDLRGRALFGADNMGGSAASRLTTAGLFSGGVGVAATPGATGGDQLQQAHTHGVTDPGHTHTFNEGWSYDNIDPGPTTTREPGVAGQTGSATFPTNSATTGITVNSAGSGGSQNVPPTAVIQWIIYAGA